MVRRLMAIPVCLFLLAAAGRVAALNVPGTTLLEWNFNQDGNLEGWEASGDVSGVGVDGGSLALAVGAGPGRIVSPVISANPAGLIAEIRLKTAGQGNGAFYYTDKLTGDYGGFEPDWVANFHISTGADFQTLQIFPSWGQLGTIVRIRFNFPPSAAFQIDRIRLLTIGAVPGAPAPVWDFGSPGEPAAWSAGGGASGLTVEGGRLRFDVGGDEGEALSGAVRHDATTADFATLRLSTTAGRLGVVEWYSLEGGQGEQWFSPRPDGLMHTYNIEPNQGSWRGTIVALGLRLVDAQGAHAELDSVAIGAAAAGPADPQILGFPPAEGLARAGRGAPLCAAVRNCGSQALQRAAISLAWEPADAVRLVDGDTTRPLTKTAFGLLPERVVWNAVAARAGEVRFTVRVRAANAPEQTLQRTISFPPSRAKMPRTSPTLKRRPRTGPTTPPCWRRPTGSSRTI
ncbi:MAG: hypothetical protein M1457_06435 [bacterium]|nr:hypothetical protein [bacterium]